jgi:beta-glucosidase
MISSGEINGTPIHASKHLITDILKKRTGFRGVVVTDGRILYLLHTQLPKIIEMQKIAVRY